MDDLYRNIWKCFRLRIDEEYSKDPFRAMLPSEIMRMMTQIEIEHLREVVEEKVKQ